MIASTDKTATHTVLAEVTLTIEVTVEARSRADAARLAKTFELDDVQLSGSVANDLAAQWVDFDQRTRVVEVTA
jgi:hypothetical protein